MSPLLTSHSPVIETNQTHLVSMSKCRSQPWSVQVILLGPAQLPKPLQSVLSRDRMQEHSSAEQTPQMGTLPHTK